MQPLRLILILIGLTSLSGCATYVSVQPSTDENVTYYSGRPIITSERPTSTVMVSPGQVVMEKNKRVGFNVSVRNDSGETVEIDTPQIYASAGPDLPLHVYTYEEMVAEIKSQAMWAAVAAGLAAAGDSMQAANAGYSTTTTTGTYQGYGTYNSYGTAGSTYGTYNGSGTYYGTSTTYDASAVAAAQAEANRNSQMRMAAIADQQASGMEMAETLLRRTTLEPGFSYEARLVVDAPKTLPGLVELSFKVGEDIHTVSFDYAKVEK